MTKDHGNCHCPEVISYEPPDVVLLDLMLPGTNGFALCEQLREWTQVPIIMITARATERDVVLGLQVERTNAAVRLTLALGMSAGVGDSPRPRR